MRLTKMIIVFAVSLLSITTGYSQKPSVILGEEVKTAEHNMKLKHFLGEYGGKMYYYVEQGGYERSVYYGVAAFDSQNNLVEIVNMFPKKSLESGAKAPYNVMACYPMNQDGDLVIVYSDYIKRGKVLKAYMGIYNIFRGWGNKKTLGEYGPVSVTDSYNKDLLLYQSPDKSSNFLVFFPTLKYSSVFAAMVSSKVVARMEVVLFDQEYNRVSEKTLERPEGFIVERIDKGVATDNKRLYLIIHDDRKGTAYGTEVLSCDFSGELPVIDNIKKLESWIKEPVTKVLTDVRDNLLYIASLPWDRSEKIQKLFYTIIDMENGEVIQQYEGALPSDVRSFLITMDVKGSWSKFLQPNQILASDDRSFTIIYSFISAEYYTDKARTYTYHNCREIIVTRINENDEFSQSVFIPRYFYEFGSKARYTLPVGLMKDNDLYILYNDHVNNIRYQKMEEMTEAKKISQNAVYLAKIDDNNHVERTQLFNSKSEKTIPLGIWIITRPETYSFYSFGLPELYKKQGRMMSVTLE